MVNELGLVDPIVLWRQILLLFLHGKKYVFLYLQRLMIHFNHITSQKNICSGAKQSVLSPSPTPIT